MKPRLWIAFVALAAGAFGQVSSDRLMHAGDEPQNWLTFSGTYASQRYSKLSQITAANVGNLEMKWVSQVESSLQKFEATPLVVDGVMYVSEPPNDVVAMDAATGRVFWTYSYRPGPVVRACCGQTNRGLAILGDRLFMGTVDAHLVAIDAKNGKQLWDQKVASAEDGYAITQAPLIVKDKVIVGPAGGEQGIRGFLAAFDPQTGKELWRFYTIPGPGEPGHESWGGDSWQHGGAPTWITGSYDPDLNLVYWGTGNPGPDYDDDVRPGDNLYSCSVVALDADTGKLKWHFQFTPHDFTDWDSTQVPVLADLNWNGAPRKVMLFANRNGFFYTLDRTNGEFLRGTAFVKQNWNDGLDKNGRPLRRKESENTVEGTLTYPGIQGGTNWFSPSFSPRTELFYVTAWVDNFTYVSKVPTVFQPGRQYGGGFPRSTLPNIRRGPINTWTEEAGHGEILALDPRTGQQKWSFKMHDVSDAGILTTAGDLLFTGSREGYFYAFDARTGQELWRNTTGGHIAATPISYQVNGKQYVAIAAGHGLFVFGLREQ